MTTTALSLAVVTVLAVPAWAQPTFTSGGEAAAGDENHQVTMEVPDDERVGATTGVVLTAPPGFTPTGCTPPSLFATCTIEGRTITWEGHGPVPHGFTVAVPASPGVHDFRVVQQGDGGDPVTWTVAMTVIGDDPGSGDGGNGAGDGGDGNGAGDGGTGDGSGDGGTAGGDAPDGAGGDDTDGNGSDGPAPDPTPTEAQDTTADEPTQVEEDAATAQPSPAPSPSPPPSSADADTTDDTSSAGGSTAPTRTQGRSNGTTLEITPGEPAEDADPTIAAPDVADQPVVATPAADDTPTGDTAAAGTTEGAPAQERPWQQVLGAALLAVGALTLGVRQWRSR